MSGQAVPFCNLRLPAGRMLDPPNPVMGRWWMPGPAIARNMDSMGNLLLIVLKQFTLKQAEYFHWLSAF
jgi:hypothetical protein